MSDGLQISADFALPLDIVTEAVGIVATRGAGKSYASAVMIEEAFTNSVQVVVVDVTGVYHGLRSNTEGNGPGLPIYVLGGPHGDVPLEPTAGAFVARLVVDSGHSFVLDVSDFSKTKARSFVADFLERLYELKARKRSTLMLVVDEADEFAPQKPRGDALRSLGAMETVAKRGRSRGIGLVLITQRTQALNKDVLDLIETLIAMRQLAERSRDAVKGWIADKDLRDESDLIATLQSLPTGQAWVWSPIRAVLERVAFRRITTFDSYATPKPGETRIEPTKRAELDLDALGDEMRSTAERAKESDPADLRRRLRVAEQALEAERAKAPQSTVETVVERVEVPVVSDEQVKQLSSLTHEFATIASTVASFADGIVSALGIERVAPPAVERREVAPRPAPPPRIDKPASVRSEPTNGNGHLNRRAERMVLAVLAQFPQGRTKRQVAILAGYAVKGGGFNGALSKLRTLGYIQGSDPLQVTDDGLAAIDGQYEPLPTGRALLDHWLSQMNRAAERTVLQVLYDAGGVPLSKDEVAERAGYEVSGGGFNGALSKLRTLELIEGRGDLRVSEDLL